MKTVLLVVDMQNDFVTGSLGTKEACKTVPVIALRAGGRERRGEVKSVDQGENDCY